MSEQPDQEQQIRRLIHEKTRGVRLGGFRPAAYSADNPQEIAPINETISQEMNLVLEEQQQNQNNYYAKENNNNNENME